VIPWQCTDRLKTNGATRVLGQMQFLSEDLYAVNKYSRLPMENVKEMKGDCQMSSRARPVLL